MDFQRIRQRLLPGLDVNPKFEEHARNLGHPGLRTIGAVEIATPLLMLAGRLAMRGGRVDTAVLWQEAAMIAAGAATLLVAATRWSRRHARPIAVVSAWLAPTLLIWAAIWRATTPASTDDYILTAITLVTLTTVASVPLLPWHAMTLGLALECTYILSFRFGGQRVFSTTAQHSDAHYIFLLMLALLLTFIAATNYEHRRTEYESHQEAIRAAEALTGAQLRAQLAESAISIGKMAAALSHEMNSPLGTLRSSIETLIVVVDRQLKAPPEQRDLLDHTRGQLRRAIEESARRIDEVSERLRRFVSLAEADLKPADLNELLSDVALLHEDELRRAGIRLEFDLERSLPRLTCRPQLLSSVFSTLLSNAIQAVDGNGHIEISTHGRDSVVEVTVRDNGRGMPPEEAETIFDPSFKVEGARVASGNWSLFNSRQIVYEHGGDIRVETAVGRGTAVHVMLPLVTESPERPNDPRAIQV